jgi:hypothetical protein
MTISRIPLSEIHTATAEVLRRHDPVAPRPHRIRRRLSRYSSSYPIQTIRTEFKNRENLYLVLKDLSPSANFNSVRPAFLCDPNREIEIYQHVLKPDLGTPLCFGAITQPAHKRYWLFLERISGRHLWQMGDIEHWNAAARWLAQLHNNSEVAARAKKIAPVLIQYDRAYFDIWLPRAKKFLSTSGSNLPPGLLHGFKNICKNYHRIVDRLASLPTSFIHGDFFASNVLLRNETSPKQICPMDWELAGFGSGLLDLAALTCGKWEPPERISMISAYREALRPIKGSKPSIQELIGAVDTCELHLAIQFLGWSDSWTPPQTHTQDWLRTAIRLAARLGL